VSDKPLSSQSARLASIDAFRGLTILLMIWVNDVASVAGTPWWMRHMPTDADGMTFVDLVFPAFLFIVGMAIPFALDRRLDRGATMSATVGHVLLRTAGLLIAGVFMVNMDSLDAEATGMSRPVWTLLVYGGIILVWNMYPKSGTRTAPLFWLLRGAGIVLLGYLATIYRAKAEDGTLLHLRPMWWGILGLIGWAYLTVCIFYLPLRRQPAALVGVVALLHLLNIASRNGALDWAEPVSRWVSLGGAIGGHGSITAAGVVLGMLFMRESPATTHGDRLRWMAWFGLALIVAGLLVWHPYKISKDHATPAWCMISAGLCCYLFGVCYYLLDVRGWKAWALSLRPAGENPLLAYILAPIIYACFQMAGVNPLRQVAGEGWPGIGMSAVFAIVVVLLTGLLGRMGLRLRF
jgi:predicted acyltransferase